MVPRALLRLDNLQTRLAEYAPWAPQPSFHVHDGE